nr:MAG TPA: hypothetical protein [Caudoviricetes sp.]
MYYLWYDIFKYRIYIFIMNNNIERRMSYVKS